MFECEHCSDEFYTIMGEMTQSASQRKQTSHNTKNCDGVVLATIPVQYTAGVPLLPNKQPQ